MIFQVISLEGWTDVMYMIQDTHSFYNFIYFVVLIIVRWCSHTDANNCDRCFIQIGTFFMINLCLVVIANQFSETRRRETAKMKQEREYSTESSFSSFTERLICYYLALSEKKEIFSFSTEDEEEDTNLYRDIINLLHYYIRRLFYRTKKYRRVKKVIFRYVLLK